MRWLKGGVAAVLLSSAAFGQGSPPTQPPPDAAAAAQEIAELKAQIDDLNRKLDGLWARYDQDQQEQIKKDADKAAVTPKVALGGEGLKISTPDGAFETKIGLKLQYDWGWFDQDRELYNVVGDEQDGTDFRAMRLDVQGKAFTDWTYRMEMDFAGQNAGDAPHPKEVWIQYNGIPYGGDRTLSLRAGHFKEPFGLDQLNSFTDRAFMEVALTDVFSPSYNAGFQLSSALIGAPKHERLTWQLGVFKETDDWPSSNDSDEDQGYQWTARVTGLPIASQDDRRLLHLGAAFSHRNPDGARLNYGLRPESRVALFRYVDPDGALLPAGFRLQDARADDVNLYGLELAGLFGPVNFQSEYVRSDVETTFGGDVTFDGWYAQAGWVITGENRIYRHDSGRFGNPIPEHPFSFRGEKRGWGAWEVLARYSNVDLNDRPLWGGEQDALTLGLNWFPNQNIRLALNWIHNEIDHPLYDGSFDELQARFQLAF